MVAMCVQRDTDATAKRKGKLHFAIQTPLFTGQEHGTRVYLLLSSLCCMEERPTAECSWQVSRARPKGPQQTLGRTNSGSHRGETRMVQHSDDGG